MLDLASAIVPRFAVGRRETRRAGVRGGLDHQLLKLIVSGDDAHAQWYQAARYREQSRESLGVSMGARSVRFMLELPAQERMTVVESRYSGAVAFSSSSVEL